MTAGADQGLCSITVQTTQGHAWNIANDAAAILGELAEDMNAEVAGHLQAGELGKAQYSAGQLDIALQAAHAAQELSARLALPGDARNTTPMGEKHDDQD